MANIETTVNELVINQLSKTKYESLKAAGSLQENQLYMVDEGTETSTSVSSIGGATGDITLGANLHIENNILSATDTTTTLNGVGGAITLGDGLSIEGSTLKAASTGGVEYELINVYSSTSTDMPTTIKTYTNSNVIYWIITAYSMYRVGGDYMYIQTMVPAGASMNLNGCYSPVGVSATSTTLTISFTSDSSTRLYRIDAFRKKD